MAISPALVEQMKAAGSEKKTVMPDWTLSTHVPIFRLVPLAVPGHLLLRIRGAHHEEKRCRMGGALFPLSLVFSIRRLAEAIPPVWT